MSRTLATIALFLLAGCTTHGRLAPPTTFQTDAAEIIVIREFRFMGGGANLTVSIDGAPLYGIATSEHVVMPVAPGYHVVSVVPKGPGRNEASASVQAVESKRYYFRVETTGLFDPSPILQPISTETGQALMEKTTLIKQ
jgi:hypothetical protein